MVARPIAFLTSQLRPCKVSNASIGSESCLFYVCELQFKQSGAHRTITHLPERLVQSMSDGAAIMIVTCHPLERYEQRKRSRTYIGKM
jgi:hypothetical protein